MNPERAVHLVFHDSFAQKALLDALSRHTTQVLGATALYDFVTQTAAFDSSIVTILNPDPRTQELSNGLPVAPERRGLPAIRLESGATLAKAVPHPDVRLRRLVG